MDGSMIVRTPKLCDFESQPLNKIVFIERSIFTDKNCFAKLCYENGKMTQLEYDTYCKWNNWLSEQFNAKADGYIYLKCDPKENSNKNSVQIFCSKNVVEAFTVE